MQRQLRRLDYRTQHSLYTCSGGSMRKPLQLYSRNAITYVATNLRYRDINAWCPDTVNKTLILIKKNFNFYFYNTKIIIFLKYYILLYLTFNILCSIIYSRCWYEDRGRSDDPIEEIETTKKGVYTMRVAQ